MIVPGNVPSKRNPGLFLLAKATFEIHHSLEGEQEHGAAKKVVSFGAVIAQIMVLAGGFGQHISTRSGSPATNPAGSSCAAERMPTSSKL